MNTITGPVKGFHLPPAVKVTTTNGHAITWYGNRLVKHYRNLDVVQFERMRQVHLMRLEHVEHGEGHVDLGNGAFEVTMTRVGVPLSKALAEGLVSKVDARREIELGLQELHNIGLAHNDLQMRNIFWDETTRAIFLDDLEYLSPVDGKPALVAHAPRGVEFTTARQLDQWQLSMLHCYLY